MLFSAFACPYCADTRKQLDQLQARYPGQIAVVYKHMPLGAPGPSYLPHEAALAAGEQGKFWEMHDALYEHPRDLENMAVIMALAEQLKLDLRRFRAALAQHSGAARIAADLAEARALRVTGTPTLYIGGYKFEGAQQASTLELMVEHALHGSGAPAAAPEARGQDRQFSPAVVPVRPAGT
jgi:protein-disulfide isomerase